MSAQRRRPLLLLSFIILFCCLITPVYAEQLNTQVNISQGGIVRPDCSGGCSYDSGTGVSLLAIPSLWHVFDSWSGDCSGNNPSTGVVMTGPKACTANFSFCPDMPVKRGDYPFNSVKEACEAQVADDTIKILATNLQESLRLNCSITLKGGYICGYGSNPSFTLIQGQMFFETGTATVENLMILSGTPPVITSFTANPSLIFSGESSTLHWTVADATEVSIDNGIDFVDPVSDSVMVTPVSTTTYKMTATNDYGTDTAQVTVSVQLPEITTLKASPDVISSGGSSTITWAINYATSVVIDQGIGEVNPASGFVNVSPTTTTVYTITLTNAAGTITKKITVGVIPPDPKDIAPAIDQTVATTIYDASSFLYTSPTPVQTGMAPETIEPKRVAVLRGKVLGDNGLPLVGVTVTLLNHPEYGQTITRPDGMFDIVVNGGGLMNVKYTKTGYLTVQRQRDIPWQDYMWLPEIRMIEADPNIAVVDLTSQADFQVVRGSVITDGRGTRQSTVLIPKGTQAWMVFPDGHEEPITSLTVRASEFTVGTNGESKMPAELPPTSAYTYCEEFTVEEAVEVGAPEVRFSQMAISYNENFLNFPVGTGIPLGAYDRERGVWIPSDNGKVIKIISITNGFAELDTDGNGTIDNGVSLGITDAERAALANLYSVGQSLWRVLVPHFTKPWDKNMGVMGEEPCIAPKNDSPFNNLQEPRCIDEATGSIIQCQSQVLAENAAITGTPYYLHYQSNRVRGRVDKYGISIPLTGSSISPTLRKVILEIVVAGQKITREYAPQTNLSDTFVWNGKDAYGREVQGRQPITVRVGYAYNLIYGTTNRFGYNGNGTPISVSDKYFIVWQVHKGGIGGSKGEIGNWDAKSQGLGGWTLNVHHAYDGTTLFLGDGGRRNAQDIGLVIDTFDFYYETTTVYIGPEGVAAGPDGSIYITDTGFNIIRRVAPDGSVSHFAGSAYGFDGDGGPAIYAKLWHPTDVALGLDGSVYIADKNNARIRKVGTDGIITTVAGGGTGGDGGLAINAKLLAVTRVAVAPDGTIYIAESPMNYGVNRIRRVGTDGIITTFAGGGAGGDGGLAKDAYIFEPGGIAIGPDGSVYFSEYYSYCRVRKVATDGIITTVAGWGYGGYSGDGGPATSAKLSWPMGIAVDTDGTLYIAERNNNVIRKVGTDGIIRTIAGTANFFGGGYSGDGGPATSALFSAPYDVAIGPDGGLYVADAGNNRIRRLEAALPGVGTGDFTLASEDGSELFIFSSGGRHLRTIDALTGAMRYQFAYDSGGRLITITDVSGNNTTIQRDTYGNPTAIIAPQGQQTALTVNADGYLTIISDPVGEAFQFDYTVDGLLTTLTDPRGFIHRFTYNSLGLLTKDEDPAGGSQSLNRTEITNGYQVSVTTAMGRSTNYSVENLPGGDQRGINIFSDGTQKVTLNKADGSNQITLPDGMAINSVLGPDPRFGMQAPLLTNLKISTPGGLTYEASENQTMTLTDPQNPLSLATLKTESTVNGQKYTINYTASTKTFTSTSPAGRQVTSKIDAQGRPVEYQIAGILPVQFTYDAQGRLISARQGSVPDVRESTFQYNTQGFLQTATDPLLRTMSFEYDQTGRVTREVLPDSRQIAYGYDANGNITSLTPPGRPSHGFTYTPVDLMAEYTPPDIGIGTVKTQYSYNTDRQLTRVLRPDGLAIDFGYDTGGRMSEIAYPGGPVTFVYDAVKGYLSQVNGPEGNAITYAYDGMLVTGENLSGAVTSSVTWTYDNSFRITGVSINGGNTIAFVYDNDNLITKAGDLTLTRSAQNGLLTGSTLGNVTDAWTYDGFGQPATYVAKYGATEIFKQQFTYDKLGRIVQKVETVDSATTTYEYAYDTTGRLIQVKKNGSIVSSYAYDSNDNRLSYTGTGGTITGTYDNQDRLIQYGTTTYSYTANGELQSKTSGVQPTLYSYDVFGNLKSVTLPGGTLIEFPVDGQNRRLGKKANGAWVHKFIYLNRLKPAAELDASDNVVSLFIYGSRFIVPDYMVKGAVTYRIIADHLGSPRLVVNTATGDIVQRMDYDEFGNVVSDTNPSFQPFRFAGGLYDPDTRLVRFGARDYDSETGRWTAKDPIMFEGDQDNLYAYVGNDPVNQIDVLGTIIFGGGGKKPEVPTPNSNIRPPRETSPTPEPEPKSEFNRPALDQNYFRRWSDWNRNGRIGPEPQPTVNRECGFRLPPIIYFLQLMLTPSPIAEEPRKVDIRGLLWTEGNPIPTPYFKRVWRE